MPDHFAARVPAPWEAYFCTGGANRRHDLALAGALPEAVVAWEELAVAVEDSDFVEEAGGSCCYAAPDRERPGQSLQPARSPPSSLS